MSQQPQSKLIAIAAALLTLTVVPAVIHGYWSQRWRDPADMAAAARTIEALPRQIGDWTQQGDDEQMPVEAVRELQCAGYINRRYVNQKLGREVMVMLMVGPSGPSVRHPPEICYGSRANKMVNTPKLVHVKTPDARDHTFRLLRFKNPSATSGEFTVCFGWKDDGSWSVPEFPRIYFGGKPMLYKIQVLSTDAVPDDGRLPVATAKFLDDFLPLLDKAAPSAS